MTAIDTGNRLIEKLPKPVQRFYDVIGLLTPIVTLFGWLASTSSLVSKMTFWQPVWDFIVSISLQFPTWVVAAVMWVGAQCHWLAQAYRHFIRPIFHWLVQWLPFEVPPIVVDLLSIACFAVFGFLRVASVASKDDSPSLGEKPFSFCARSGILFPIMLVQVLPLVLFFNMIFAFRAFGHRINMLLDWLGEHVGRWAALTVLGILAFPALAAFPASIFLIEWIYTSVGGR